MIGPARPTEYMRHVLVVEDDFTMADWLSEVLTYQNLEVDVASNGLEAMEKIRSMDYDGIVSDLIMPRQDGESLYEEIIKEFPYLAEKIVFITGDASQKGGMANFTYHTGNILLVKPFEAEQLTSAVLNTLER